MNILLLFTDPFSCGYLYLFQPVCRDGEVLVLEVLKERDEGEPPSAVVSTLQDLQLGCGKLNDVI